MEKYRTPKLVVRRDGSNLRSRFVALWEPTNGAKVVDRVENLATGDPELVALDIHTTGEGEVIRTLYSSEPDRRHRVNGGTEFQGRYAVVRSTGEAKHLALYDTTCYHDGDLTLDIADRPPLPLTDVNERDGGFVVSLKGEWEDTPKGEPLVFGEPEHVLLTDGAGHQRAFPVDSVEFADGRTLLRCSRHPGFEYDTECGVLAERFFPFHRVEGRAEVRIPGRAWVRSDVERSGTWRVRTTASLTINGTGIGPTDEWVSVSR